ncbi:MAG: PAS domain-containing protein [Verrucomicrobiales bacterium]|nr:PAS domain-containing protein [Verrucomicrobiales bacterium]
MKPDFILFTIIAVLLFAALQYFWWRRCFGLVHRLAWMGLFLVLPLGWWMAKHAENRERRYLMDPLTGFAPTYAEGMARMGHTEITSETDAEDPQYLELINVQKSWLKANPKAASIYTYRLNPDFPYEFKKGEPVHFVVCCEVDYDKNGVYEGDDESRVENGEPFEDTDNEMLQVFLGKTSFGGIPSADRWGTWITAYAPIFGPDGKVEAAVGVDFDAATWVESLQRARATVLVYAGLIVLALAGGASVASNQIIIQENLREREIAELTRIAKEKFKTLVNSIEGVVYEWDPAQNRFIYTSDQTERILGVQAKQWLEATGSWEEHLHPDDSEVAIARRKELANSEGSYYFEYRILDDSGQVKWIREIGNPAHDKNGEITLLRGVLHDITEQKESASELEKTHRQLVDTSRRAGMAEVATGVLHNVGNVLNSVNVASTLIHQRLNNSRLGTLGQLSDLLKSQGENLPVFFDTDPRGKMIPGYLNDLSRHLALEQTEVLLEVDKLVKNIEHIKNIVDLQQGYARTGGSMEPVNIVDLIEDSLGINSASLTRHRIRLVKQVEESLPLVFADRNKVLQILVNLIRNAKHAVDDADSNRRDLGIAVQRSGDRVRINVADTGTGIAPENMCRLFSHGFTTRKDGHGFGLHSSEAAAREMGGTLTAHSDGPGFGAVFTLELGVFQSESPQSSPRTTVQPAAEHAAA